MNEAEKQILYRDARLTNKYDSIWQSVNKCVFCDLNEKYVFFEENGVVMTITLYAYIDGHFMIVPRRHIRSIRELSQLEWDTVRKFLYIAKKLIKDVHGIKGMQLVEKDGTQAQSTVEHVHFHCVPFDSPDLCTWNFRKLKYTPLENVSKYKDQKKKIVTYGTKFDTKYQHANGMRVNCNLLALNTKGQVLLHERSPDVQLVPNYLTMPGGMVDNFDTTLEEELAREVREETGYQVDTAKLTLIDTRIGQVERRQISKQLRVAYKQHQKFIWITYKLENIPANTRLVPGDDCKSLMWVDIKDAVRDANISPETREIIAAATHQKSVRGNHG